MMTIQCRIIKRKTTKALDSNNIHVVGLVATYKIYKMFDETGKVVKVWDETVYDFSECWNIEQLEGVCCGKNRFGM